MKKCAIYIWLYTISALCSSLSQAKLPLYVTSDLHSDSAIHGSLELIHCLFLKGDILIKMEEESAEKKYSSYPLLTLKEKNNHTVEAFLYGSKGKEHILLTKTLFPIELQRKLCSPSILALKEKNTLQKHTVLETVKLKNQKSSLFQKKEFWIAAALLGVIGLNLARQGKQSYTVQGIKINR